MINVNRVFLAGRLTKDPEIRYLPSGTPVASFSIALNSRTKQGGESKEETYYFDVVAYAKTGELVAEYLHKGSGVLVEGRLKQRQWEKDGVKRKAIEVVAESVQFLDRKGEGGEGRGASAPAADGPDEDMPF